MVGETVQRRPIHEIYEVIVDAINRASYVSDMELLEKLIMGVQIPRGHNEIIAAWQKKRGQVGWPLERLVADLLEQKREAAKKAKEKKEDSSRRIFPPYLDQGSTGAVVNFLGLILNVLRVYGSDHIILDGDYALGGAIAEAVKELQRELGLTGEEVDGNFGPATRAALKETYRIDVDTLTTEMFAMPTVGKEPESA